ncbi:phage tail fiber protein [Xenorhabdus sp. KK7.4]|uniref:phage tail fiber protein n=1 Tax=Xenorhabdus sp. KK7.4 TaxID=1851572 RepID=UPI000C03E926|nr:hypothetical protein [Xenorhabdus sp. KK7.4]PHM51000.1 hypothetical protein Xekk_04077 [Xenorhabdus sp. KK7.4]
MYYSDARVFERNQNQRIKAIVNGEKVYYQDGEPCDIPEGCRLDIRVQMPANSAWNVKQRDVENFEYQEMN